ncbi:MAG: hypothetical protein PHO76_13000 [Methylotenera sp.]|nr:hypothetical protein [Methylotenera sp.]MDD4926152.1 hypothetical protein [Methylotenera sp.]
MVFSYSTSYAGNNAAPLGQELGVTTLKQFQESIGVQTQLTETGTNKFSGGVMLEGNGEGLGVDGLTKILVIFNASNQLSGVVMTMSKSHFQETMNALSKKYKLVNKQVPFVGNKFAKYKQGNSVVMLDSPHMSFDMELRYLTNEFLASYTKTSADENAENKRNQASKF